MQRLNKKKHDKTVAYLNAAVRSTEYV